MQEHWLAAPVKMEPRKMLCGELLVPGGAVSLLNRKRAGAWRRKWLAA